MTTTDFKNLLPARVLNESAWSQRESCSGESDKNLGFFQRVRKCASFPGEHCASLLGCLAQFLNWKSSSWYGFQLQPDTTLQEQPWNSSEIEQLEVDISNIQIVSPSQFHYANEIGEPEAFRIVTDISSMIRGLEFGKGKAVGEADTRRSRRIWAECCALCLGANRKDGC